MRPVAKVLSVAVGLAAVLATAGSALAHDRDDDGWKHWKHRHHHGPRFVPPGHVYYVERPVVVVPLGPSTPTGTTTAATVAVGTAAVATAVVATTARRRRPR